MTRSRRSVRFVKSLRVDKPIHAVAGCMIGVTTTEPVFHLTFDDGPHPVVTPRVLDALDEHRAKATFFVLTQQAEEHPDVLHEVIGRGHHIALHSRTHPRLTELAWGSLIDEIRDARRDLEKLARRPVTRFRPPYGAQNFRSLSMARGSGMKTVLWSVDSRDWKGLTRDEPLERARPGLVPGGMLLMHDTPVGDTETEDAAHGFIPKDELTRLYLDELGRLGMQAVSLDELLSSGRQRRKAKFG